MLVKSKKSYKLTGELFAPPDKSISHRAVILSSLTYGVSNIHNLLVSEDINVTLNWAKNIGVTFKKYNNVLEVTSSIDINSKKKNSNFYNFYLGNSGTSARLLMGVMSGFGGTSIFYGDPSLNKRPMLRIIEPLTLMNSEILTVKTLNEDELQLNTKVLKDIKDLRVLDNFLFKNNLILTNKMNTGSAYLPTLIKSNTLKGINYTLNIASAQVKSAILLAGLFTKNKTVVIEPNLSRDHTENMLKASGVNLKVEYYSNKCKKITLLQGKKTLKQNNWYIPGDFSSAAFILVAALIVPGSHILIKNVNLNPLRTGLLTVLKYMGADIIVVEKHKVCGERFGDLKVKYTKNLKPVLVNSSLVPSMIDEFPILSCLVSLINGKSQFCGINELRYKESDRISTIETYLNMLGIRTSSSKDSLVIYGNSNIITRPTTKIMPKLDHRIAMSFVVLGMVMEQGIIIEDAEVINTSFPQFINIMKYLGANVDFIGETKMNICYEL